MNLPLTQLAPKEVEALDADQLVRLLHRLLLCEARHHHVKTPGILVPYQINVPDGGRDAMWHADIGMHEFIPRPVTYYQCKAERVTAASARDEVIVERKDDQGKKYPDLKDRVREVLSNGGCYAFFSSKHEIEPTVATELEKTVRDELAAVGFTPHADAKIVFLGCNRIADWANRFPSAVRFVRESTKSLGGVHFYTVDLWQREIQQQGPYFANATLKEKIAAIRTTLVDGKKRVIRLTGPSGLGKTRLVFEAVKPEAGAPPLEAALSADTIYLSYADVPDDLVNFISHLAAGDYSGIVVIDDCPDGIHDRLVTKVAPSALSLVTIFHEPQAARQDTQPLELEPATLSDVVENILRQDQYLLAHGGEDAVKAITEFTQGYPQIAKLITEFHRAPSKQELSSRAGLFQKLLSAGREPEPVTLKTIESLSLFRAIGGSKQKLSDDLKAIRKLFCPDVTESDFLRVIEDQKRRRIVQVTADTLTIAPRPLAVALAANFLPVCPGDFKDHVAVLKQAGLAEDLAWRIEQLESSEKVEELGRLFLEEKLPFDDAEYLLSGATAPMMFRSFSVLNPSSASKVLRRTLGRVPLKRLAAAKDARRDLVRAINVMVWERPGFFEAAPLLLRFAAAENESWSNNATGEFGQLFRVYLSGTTVPALERLPILRDGLGSPEPAIRQVAVGALGSALQTGHFTRMSDTTLAGKRDANKDWRPATYDEFHGYWKECYLLLQNLIIEGGSEAELAKATLAKHIDSILGCRLLLTLESEFKALAEFVNSAWPEMKNAIRRTLDYSKDLVTEHRAALERWLSYVTPKGGAIEERLRDIVSHPGYHHRKEPDESFTDLSQQDAEQLAHEFAQAGTNLTPYLGKLLTGEQQQGTTFGLALTRRHPAAKQLLEDALAAWPTLKSNTRNESLIRGLFVGVEDRAEKTRILNRVANEAGLVDLLIPLTGVVGQMTEADFLRVRRAIEDECIPIERLRGLIPGLPLRTLPDEFIQREFVDLARAKPATAAMLFDVLALHCHNDRARLLFFTGAFRELLLMPNLPVLETHFGWQWHEIASALIAATNNADWLARVAHYILAVLKTEETYVGTDYLRQVTIALLQKDPTTTWPVFAAALADHDSPHHYIFKNFLCGGGHGFEEEATDSPVAALPLAQFQEWLHAHRDLAPDLLDSLPLYEAIKGADGKLSYHWRPQALLLIDCAADEDEAMGGILRNLWSFGSVGSRLPYWERRKALVTELAAMPNQKYQRIARELDAEIDRVIEQTKRQEMNEQARFK